MTAAPAVLRDRPQGTRHMRRFIIALTKDTSGQDLIEYALLAGFISLAAVTAILNVGSGVNGIWGSVEGSMP